MKVSVEWKGRLLQMERHHLRCPKVSSEIVEALSSIRSFEKDKYWP